MNWMLFILVCQPSMSIAWKHASLNSCHCFQVKSNASLEWSLRNVDNQILYRDQFYNLQALCRTQWYSFLLVHSSLNCGHFDSSVSASCSVRCDCWWVYWCMEIIWYNHQRWGIEQVHWSKLGWLIWFSTCQCIRMCG